MVSRPYVRSLALSAFAVLSCLLPDPAAGAGGLSPSERARLKQSGKIEPAALQKVEAQGKARVMIVFATPDTVPGAGPDPLRRAAIRTAGDRVLGALRGELTLARRFEHVSALAGEVTAAGLLRLEERPDVLRVGLDLPGKGAMDEVRSITRLDILNGSWTGQGVTVAVLDSGIDLTHPDLSDDLVAEQCFCSDLGNGCCPNGGTQQSGPGSAQDDNGHGTNVTGILTGAGTVAPQGGAPDAGIVAVKVLDANNSFCCTSDVVAGLDWILANRPDVDLVNMSLGTFALYSGHCDQADASTMALSAAIGELRERGVSVFAATGNQGWAFQTAAPSCVEHAMAVAATYDGNHGPLTFGTLCADPATAVDQVTCFSNTDATTDLLAPGAFTTATGLGGGTSTYAGTSMAAPTAASCAAVLLQHDPYLRPRQIQRALRTSPTLVTDLRNFISYPRLDCLAAYNASAPAFADVPASYWARDWIEEIYARGITGGCAANPLQYCPGDATTREQMAVFLLRAQSGPGYTPPPCTGIFADVPCTSFFAPWIEELYHRGITTGCATAPLSYCPGSPVSREQMAVFLLRTQSGPSYTPPACTGFFADTPCTNPYAPWAEEAYRRGITTGCSTTPLSYCPMDNVTRDQMAIFIVRAFGF